MTMNVEQPADPAGDWKDVRFVCDRYSISAPTAWRWTKAGLLPQPVKIGPNTTRWRMSELLAFENQRAQGAA